MHLTQKSFLSLFCILLILPTLALAECTLQKKALAECTCDAEDEGSNKTEALKYKLAAIASILVAGAVGVCIPILGKTIPALHPDRNIFFLIKAFAAGVILATGFIHVLPDALESLTSPCLNENPWEKFPFTGFVAMVSAIGTLMVDSISTAYFSRSKKVNGLQTNGGGDEEKTEEHVQVHTHATHGHSHGPVGDSAETQLLRHRVISKVLELGIVVHSVIIGISLGASQSPDHIRPLVAALSFHQFFEGMGLGSCITQAKESRFTTTIMVLFFALTTPVGIAIGIRISSSYKENSPTALILQGSFDAAAAGILIYMALVDLLAADFMSTKLQKNMKLHIGANLSLLVGAGCMSLIAIWA